MSKSKCIQHCYHKANHNQSTLDGFIFSLHEAINAARLPLIGVEPMAICQESVKVEILPVIHEKTVKVEIPPAIQGESVEVIFPLTNQEDEIGWEDDLGNVCMELVPRFMDGMFFEHRPGKTWKKADDMLSISTINQLLILHNFVTLWLKGYGKIDASLQIAQQWHEGNGRHYACRV